MILRAALAGFKEAAKPCIVVSVFMNYSSTWKVCSLAGND